MARGLNKHIYFLPVKVEVIKANIISSVENNWQVLSSELGQKLLTLLHMYILYYKATTGLG